MTKDVGSKRKYSAKEKSKIARELIEGYKKMAELNRKLAEDIFVEDEGETVK